MTNTAAAERVAALRSALEETDRPTNQQWLGSLSARKLEEIEFHDHDRDVAVDETAEQGRFERDTANKKYYSTVGLSTGYIQDWIARDSLDRVVLDYACGAGHSTDPRAAKAGAPRWP